jgi:GAF domain-containing protein
MDLLSSTTEATPDPTPDQTQGQTQGQTIERAPEQAPEQAATAALVEERRMAAVRRYDILDSPPDGSFDRITRLAARLFHVPISIVSIVDTDRIWFKSHHGIDVEQIDRDPGLCASAIMADDVYVVTDARMDPRTLANPLVAGSLGLQFYAAQPLVTHDGHRLGTLCVIDKRPREISFEEMDTLRTLAQVVMDEMELRLSASRAIALERERRKTAEETATRMARAAEAAQSGLESNRQIGKALGLMMANYGLSDQAALAKLKGYSQDLNIKLRVIADELVAHHNSKDD